MEVQSLIDIFTNAGVTVVILAYFIYRDLKFMQALNSTLATVDDTLEDMKLTLQDISRHTGGGDNYDV